MKKQKIKLTDLRIKSTVTTNTNDTKSKTQKYGGGYTWVG